MSTYFVSTIFWIALSDIVLFWLCLEQHVLELQTADSSYQGQDWWGRLGFLCGKHYDIAVFASMTASLLFVELMIALSPVPL